VYTDYNAGLFRSPEEYAYTLQSEKIDVFALGNILYVLLTDKEPFEDIRKEHNSTVIKELVQNGIRPILKRYLYESLDPSVNALIKAMEMCHELDWRKRARAIEVRDYLEKQLRDILSRNEKSIPHRSSAGLPPPVQHDEEGFYLLS
jgi:serine/threonine protein kinase